MAEEKHPAIGSIWREDYDYGAGHDRIVEVVGYADDGRALIQRVQRNGLVGKITKANPKRFGKSRGYLVAERP